MVASVDYNERGVGYDEISLIPSDEEINDKPSDRLVQVHLITIIKINY